MSDIVKLQFELLAADLANVPPADVPSVVLGLTTLIRGDQGYSWTGGSYDPSTGKVTLTGENGLQVETDDLRGAAATIEVGTVRTVDPDEPAAVDNVGTLQEAVLDFDIPRGAGWTGGSYEPGTGKATFASDDGLEFETDDLRGADGWSPVLALVADGARYVAQVADWAGGQGTKPATGDYVGEAGLVPDAASAVDVRGPQGVQGFAGWAPVFGLEADGLRIALKVTDWAGGTGTKPSITGYLDANGDIVPDIIAGMDIRGAAGTITEVVAGTGTAVDDSDPARPVVSADVTEAPDDADSYLRHGKDWTPLELKTVNGQSLHGAGNVVIGPEINNIGVPGAKNFGVGLCPVESPEWTPWNGVYGNYQFADGSVACWIPAHWVRWGHPDNPTYSVYGVNSVDVRPLNDFPSHAEANAPGYFMHRAFMNAGEWQLGVFRDKFDASLNGTIASSIPSGMPLVSGPVAGQDGFAQCTANGQSPANNYGGALAAVKSRGAKWFVETVFIADMLATLEMAHAQASASATYCAWYDGGGTKNFAKGNNNNALRDTDDTSVEFTSAGNVTYPAFALTGSGVPFAKTTHNGQDSGVADVNGNIYNILLGMTCIATSKSITGASNTNPVQVSVTEHGLETGDYVLITSAVGMTEINNKIFTITKINDNQFSLDGADGTGMGTWTSGGTVIAGTFHLLKESVDVAALTGGNSTASDHWGATGVAANFDVIRPNFNTAYPTNDLVQRVGNDANAVLDWSSAPARALSMAGLTAAGGVSPAGTVLFGQDYAHQYIRNELCVLGRLNWGFGRNAGSRARSLSSYRSNSSSTVGFAASRYL